MCYKFIILLAVAHFTAFNCKANNEYQNSLNLIRSLLSRNSIGFNMLAERITYDLSIKCDRINRRELSLLENAVDIDNVRMYIFVPGDGFHKYQISDAPKSLIKSNLFDPLLKTIIYVHGYYNTPYEAKIENIAEKYAQKGGYNFLSFDTSEYTFKSFTWGAGLTPYMGEILANFIVDLVAQGISSETIHIIGYSLGSHIAGVAGRIYENSTGTLLPRITALEPPTLCFSSLSSPKLKDSDAKYVDVIHTSLLSLTRGNIGHADFYVNGNIGEQPGCEDSFITCSHRRSSLLYAESILNEEAFMATRCESWSHFLKRDCPSNIISFMGYPSSELSRGSFFLKTSDFSPFGMMYKGAI